MLGIILLLAVSALCQADLPVTPPESPKVSCGYIPKNVLECIGNPILIPRDVTAMCASKRTECDRLNCIFRTSEWMEGHLINTVTLTAYFEQYAKDHPAWAPAVKHVKASCLTGNLPIQGAFLDCSSFDVLHCALTAFLRNAQPSQWSTSEACTQTRQFVAACPICPDACFSPAIPVGSCNACRTYPAPLS